MVLSFIFGIKFFFFYLVFFGFWQNSFASLLKLMWIKTEKFLLANFDFLSLDFLGLNFLAVKF